MNTAATDAQIREENPRQGAKDFFHRSGVLAALVIFVLLAVIFTIREAKSPPYSVDEEKAAFVTRAEQLLESEKGNLWLSGKTAGELVQQGNWETMDDRRMTDVDEVARELLGRSAEVSDWETLMFAEIDRLWQDWSAMDPRPDLETYLTEAVADLAAEQTLPGLGPNLWLAVTPYDERYILAFSENQWAICPVENLQ